LKKQNEQLLLFLALQTGLHAKAKTSTAKIAKHFAISQQTASRKLRELHKEGLITLNASPTGCTVSLTKEGTELLRQQFLSLQRLFEKGRKRQLHGLVKNGLGEGRYYVSRPLYLKQFKKLLGAKPFLGTLNLVVDLPQLNSFLSGLPVIEIPGFKTEERSFGRIKAFRVSVEGKQQAAVIFPDRSAHAAKEIEVIASVNLRKKFKLKEGSKVLLKQP